MLLMIIMMTRTTTTTTTTTKIMIITTILIIIMMMITRMTRTIGCPHLSKRTAIEGESCDSMELSILQSATIETSKSLL